MGLDVEATPHTTAPPAALGPEQLPTTLDDVCMLYSRSPGIDTHTYGSPCAPFTGSLCVARNGLVLCICHADVEACISQPADSNVSDLERVCIECCSTAEAALHGAQPAGQLGLTQGIVRVHRSGDA